MKKVFLLFILVYSSLTFGFNYPFVSFWFTTPPPTTVFYGDTLRIPISMYFRDLRQHAYLYMPEGSYLEPVSGLCPAFPVFWGDWKHGSCNMNLVIAGNKLGKIIKGSLTYRVRGEERRFHLYHWNHSFKGPVFRVTVIPHPLSMLPISVQVATVNQAFYYPLAPAVKFYNENAATGLPIYGVVTPAEQDGLYFDKPSFAIKGTPKRVGTYLFQVSAYNSYGRAAPGRLQVEVGINPKDKPILRQPQFIASAHPMQNYNTDLMLLVEPKPGFMITNQLQFSIEYNHSNATWLHISAINPSVLEGQVPPDTAGQEAQVIIVATSNTGGSSQPLTIKIPIAYDTLQKPVIENFALEKAAGANLYENLLNYIKDPAQDPEIKVLLEKVEPAAPWLKMSDSNPPILEGEVPYNATGQKYLLTLRANTRVGGSSEALIIPLQISIQKEFTPKFRRANPILPLVYPGQAFFYDFVINNDIYPEYSAIPYEINFAENSNPPAWLRLENNKLIAERVPDELANKIALKLVVKNIPGGLSKVKTVTLTVMH